MDMAVGVIIGGAFNGIITSLIDCIINPVLGMFAGDGTALAGSLSFRLPGGGELMLGSFLTSVLNFLVMALVVFCIVKALNALHRKKEDARRGEVCGWGLGGAAVLGGGGAGVGGGV
ncbi:MAG: MscL family protein, partial [Oscillospiraceae bacterium]